MTAPQSSRLAFLDWLRAFSILFMIETHALNSLLKPSLKEPSGFQLLNFFNGLVAPSFLFVSGWVFVVASSRKLDDFRSLGPALGQQLLRIGLVWALGYGLHVPGYAFSALRHSNAGPAWRVAFQVDILHSIAAGLLLLLAGRIWIKAEARFEQIVWLAAVLFVFAAPWLWNSDLPDRLPVALAGYVAARHNSLFPLFPWFGFMLAGAACAICYARAEEARAAQRFFRVTAACGIVLIVAGHLFARYGFPWPYGTADVRAHPVFFGLRLGYVFLLLWICSQLQTQRVIRAGWMTTLSRESLLLYVAHILVLYRLPGDGVSLSSVYGKSLSFVECGAVIVFVVLLMWIMATTWSWLKSQHRKRARHLSYVAGTAAVLLFLLR